MNRRSFFSRVLSGIAAAVTAPFLPKLAAHTLGSVGAAPTVHGLVFHPDAFAMTMRDLPTMPQRFDLIFGMPHLIDRPSVGSFLAYCDRERALMTNNT